MVEIYDGVHVEPTDESFRQAVEFAQGSGRVRGNRRRFVDRHGQGDQPHDHLPDRPEDIPALVEGTLHQQRLLVMAPRPVNDDDVAAILRASMENW
jgi:alcohol dehydrogenase class IV